MEPVQEFISNLSDIVWGPPMLTLIVLTGVILSARLRLIQIRRLAEERQLKLSTDDN
jgi:AGCS family alanine or glycine:cation symporter